MQPSLKLVYWFARRKFFMAVLLGAYYIAMERLAWPIPYAEWVFASAALFVIPEGLSDVIRALKGTDTGMPWERTDKRTEEPPPQPQNEQFF